MAEIKEETELALPEGLPIAREAQLNSKNARKKRVRSGSSGSSGPSVQNRVEMAFEIASDPARQADLSIALEILFSNNLADHRSARPASRLRRSLLGKENRHDSQMLNQTRSTSKWKK